MVQRRRWVVLGEVQVRARIEDDRRVVGKRRMRVEQVALVPLDLARRVEHVARLAAVVDRHAVGDVGAADLGPLLELDDDGRVALRVWVRAGDQDVEALRRERQLELDEDALVTKVGQLENVGHRREGVAPGRDLGWRRPIPELVEEAVREHVREACLCRVGDELFAGALIEVQPPSARTSVGSSASLAPASRIIVPTELRTACLLSRSATCVASISIMGPRRRPVGQRLPASTPVSAARTSHSTPSTRLMTASLGSFSGSRP